MTPDTVEGMAYRLTQYAYGGGSACKIPPGKLAEVVRGPTKGGAAQSGR